MFSLRRLRLLTVVCVLLLGILRHAKFFNFLVVSVLRGCQRRDGLEGGSEAEV